LVPNKFKMVGPVQGSKFSMIPGMGEGDVRVEIQAKAIVNFKGAHFNGRVASIINGEFNKWKVI